MREHDDEPIPGLPERLPDGERILWQGAPCWRSLARRAFLTRTVSWYFAALIALRFAVALSDGASVVAAAGAASALGPLWLAAVGVLALMAWATAKSTLYTITTARVVMRFGVALPVTINVPFTVVGTAALKLYPGGRGEIPLTLSTEDKFAYLILWPHARPWRFRAPEPMLRTVPEAENVARVLVDALAAYGAQTPAPQTVDAADAAQSDPSRDPARGRSQPGFGELATAG